jgi:hydrophobe/amphiphile efflux-1 (HAE1) family protein
MWLTRLALRNPILILMMSLMVLALGGVAFQKLAVDLFPDITIPVIRVATFYPGAGPGDIEKSITQPVERAVAASPGVDRVESNSKQGVSVVSVWFNYGTNLDSAQFEVSQRVQAILNTLPPGIQQPFVTKFDITSIPVVQIVVSSDTLDERQLYDLSYNVIEPQFERLAGVASASVGGGKQREIEVKVDRERARARGIALLDIVDAVKSSNLLLASGDLRAGDLDYYVFTNTQVDDPRPLRDVVVRPGTIGASGTLRPPVRVSDVADIEDASADQQNIVRINGKRGVFLRVLKQPGANTIAVVDSVAAAMNSLRGVPPNVKLAIGFDQSQYIRAAVKSLQHEAVQGGALAIFVILLFLVSVRATGIIAVAIPLSVVATFVLLYFSGQSLNVFTLGGLALGIGRLVDDSIVELENIHRHLAAGSDRKHAVLAAAQEVAMPILVSTITTVIVFFPVLFLTGVARNLFLPLALTITFALVMSFFVSRTVTPLLCLQMLPSAHEHGGKKRFGDRIIAVLDRMDHAYGESLRWGLRHRGAIVLGILAIFGGSLFLVKRIGTEFFPASDESQFQVIYRSPIGTRVDKTEQVAERIEDTIRSVLPKVPGPEGERLIASTMIADTGLPGGRSALFSPNSGTHAGTVNVNLIPRLQRPISDVDATEKVRAAVRTGFPGTQIFFFTGGIVKRILNFGAAAPIDIEILGYDLDESLAYGKRIMPRLRELVDEHGNPLLTDVQLSREENYPEIRVNVDREKAGVLGVTEQQIAQTVLTGLSGNTQFAPIPYADPKTGNEYFINVRLDDPYRGSVNDVSDLFLRTPTGAAISLSNVARVDRSSGPVTIGRKYLQRILDVTANVAPGATLGAASNGVERVLTDMPPPDGFTAQLGGQTAAQREAFSGLALAALMALALVYMVLASQFKSLLDPLVIMFSVPMGISGVILVLWATKTTLSVNSAMGVIMMVGIVVSNGVLLVDFANVLRGRGEELIEATVKAARTRLRPILMTSIATVVGLIPMAIGIGEGSETNLPLARAVIGGLTVSTFFTLYLVPSLYTLLERFAKRTPGEATSE